MARSLIMSDDLFISASMPVYTCKLPATVLLQKYAKISNFTTPKPIVTASYMTCPRHTSSFLFTSSTPSIADTDFMIVSSSEYEWIPNEISIVAM